MRKLTLLTTLLLFVLTGFGQTYLTESFEGTWTGTPAVPAGWSIIHTTATGGASGTDPIYWAKNTYSTAWSSTSYGTPTPAGAQNGSSVAWYNDYNAKSTQKDMLVVDVDLATSVNPRLTFFFACNASSSAVLKIRGSIDGGSTWEDLMTVPRPGVAWTKTAFTLPSTYKIATAKIGFEVTGSYGLYDLWLDNVVFEEAPTPLHGVYTIDNTLPTTTPMVHDGTGNFASFTAAVNALNDAGISAAVTFNVLTNLTFTEDVPQINTTGTSANTVTFKAFGSGPNPVIRPTGGTGTTDAGITLNGVDYYTFDGIDINIASGSAVEYGYYVKNASTTNGAQYNTIKSCNITLNRANTSSRAIYSNVVSTPANVDGANSYNTYNSNTIQNSYSGIYLTGNATYPDLNTVVSNNTVGAATANDIGNGTSAANGIRTTAQSNITISNNIVRNVTVTGSSVAAYGIYMESGQGANNLIFNNKVYTIGTTATVTGSTVYGLRTDINSSHSVYVYNNMVSDLFHGITTPNATWCIRGMAVGVSGTGTGYFAYNSVLIQEDAAPTSMAFYINGGIANLTNNIFANMSTAGATSKRYAIYRGAGTVNSNYNDLYVDGTGTNNFVGFYTSDQATLANWRTASSNQDLNSISANPEFVSVTDLHTTASVLNGVGIPVSGITTDIDGDLRDVLFPDLGADENLTPATFTCATPAPGSTQSTSNPICLGDDILLSLQNTTSGTGVSYQWQSSPDGSLYSDVASGNNATLFVANAVPMFYKCNVTCHNGPETVASTPIQIAYANSVLSTTPGTRCGAGSVALAATANATLNWYDVASGGVPVATGSPFNTPVISATTTYYAASESTVPSVIASGTGATTSSTFSNPFYSLWSNSHTQHLVLASELTDAGLVAGNITSVALDVTSEGTLPMIDLSVKIGTTTATNMAAFVPNGTFQEVFTSASLMPTAGLNVLTFTTPFAWDGVSNIVLEFCHGNGSSTATMSRTVRADATSYVSSIKTHVSAATAAATICGDVTSNLLTYSVRPTFTFAGQSACSSARVPVVATVTSATEITLTPSQTVCNNAVATVSVTSTLSEYDSYVWTPEANLFTDITCTTPYVAGTSASTVYLKTAVAGEYTLTCTANNSATLCSDIETTTVTVIPSAVSITVSPDVICNSGIATFSATPVTGWGSATFQWWASEDGTTFVNTGATNLTESPTLTATTWANLHVFAGSNLCFESQNAIVTVNNPQITSTTPGSRCGTGTVNLAATSSTGTVMSWYDVATGGTAIGSGASFTTPVINTTTTYYVAAEKIDYQAGHVQVGTGTSVSTSATQTPFNTLWEDGKHQYLYLASELTALGLSAGNIDAIALNVTSVGSPAMSNFGVFMGNSNVSALTTTYETGLTSVYSNAAYTPAGTGWQTITLSQPFVWDGTSNVIVQFCFGNNTSYSSNSHIQYTTTTSNLHHYGYQDDGIGCDMTAPTYNNVNTARANMRFYGTLASVCASDRTAVTATVNTPPAVNITASSNDICAGETITLDASSTHTGYTFSWSDGSWNATGSSVNYNPLVNSTVTLTGADNTGGAYDGCVATETIAITVRPVPANVMATASSTSITCGSSFDLHAMPPSGNVVILEENFNGATNSWTTINNSINGTPAASEWTLRPDGYLYLTYTFHSNDNSQFYLSNSDEQGSGGTTATILESPSFSTLGLNSLSLNFWHFYGHWTGSSAKVEVWDGSTWNTIATYTATDGNVDAFVNKTYSLNTYVGLADVKIRFKYDAPYGFFWAIDNVVVESVNPTVDYAWTSVPAGFTSALQNITGVSPLATTEYTVVVTNSLGCSASASVNVTVNNLPAPTVTVVDNCGQSTLTASNYTGTLTWNTSENTESIIVTTGGDYHVIYTDNGCVSEDAMGNANPIAIPAVPVVNDVTVCYGQPVPDLTATGTGTINWYDDASLNNLVYTGAVFATGVTTTGTHYYYVNATENGCTSNVETVVLDILQLPAALITDSQNPTTCGATDGYITASGGTSYIWSANTGSQTTATAANLSAGTYYVTVSDGTCSATAYFTLTDPGAPSVLLIVDNSYICPGSDATFTASGADTYEFFVNGVSQGAASATYTITISNLQNNDQVTCTGTTTAGCSGVSNWLTMTTYPVTPVTIAINLPYLTSDATSGNQWFEVTAGELTGETGQNIEPVFNGDYYVVVTDGNGCTATSNIINVTWVSVGTTAADMVKVYPNPSTGMIQVAAANISVIEVTAIDGRRVMNSEVNSNRQVIDLTKESKGVYFVKVISNNNATVHKVVIE